MAEPTIAVQLTARELELLNRLPYWNFSGSIRAKLNAATKDIRPLIREHRAAKKAEKKIAQRQKERDQAVDEFFTETPEQYDGYMFGDD